MFKSIVVACLNFSILHTMPGILGMGYGFHTTEATEISDGPNCIIWGV
jgi:hypothetical protein